MKRINFLKSRKALYWGIGILIAVIALSVFLKPNAANASETTTNTEERVTSLTVAESIETSGSLEAQPFAQLNWKTDGVVEKVNVRAGDYVQAGDILMTLQPSSTSASIVSAQADLVNAQKELDDLLNSNTELAQTVIDLKDAKEEYEDAVNYLEYLHNSQKVPQTNTLVSLVSTARGYEYRYKTKNFKGPAPQDWIIEAENDLALKKAQMDELQRSYDRLKDGPNSQDVLAAQAKVDAAQATVNSLYIIAPFDGQVLSVDSHAGDSVNAGDLSINLADMNQLYVEAQVDESDVANVKEGQQAQVTLDALSGVTWTGEVTAINPVGEEVSGLVKYKVRIDLQPVKDQSFIPLGTTANVTIQVKDATASLAVPITAIQNDDKGEFVRVIQEDSSIQRVDVVSGSIVGDLVVVTGDLQEGDRVQSNQASNFQAPNPFGGRE